MDKKKCPRMKNYFMKYFDSFKLKIRLKTAIISQVYISVFGVSNESAAYFHLKIT